MTAQLKNITLGTAGHIDHGKTELVKLLTGCDTDRLKTEKDRGMSIELGFAPCLVEDLEVGIVDVPGHENFIRTMVAGAAGIDAVIFVVAADDGVMPQTIEHLDILTLLGVKDGLTVITKSDLATQARIQDVCEQIQNLLTNTFLQNKPILPVSNTTADGFDQFRRELKALINRLNPRSREGIFRLPIERTFTIKGYGTVVTGIPIAGQANVGDELTILPRDSKSRIRAVQVYKHQAQTVIAGQCAALNMPNADYRKITRGQTVTQPGYFTPAKWLLCEIKILPRENYTLKNAAKMQFHTGTSETSATVYLMSEDSIKSDHTALVQIRLENPLIAGPNDPFIIRAPSPVRTIGGGRIIEQIPKRLKRSKAHVREDAQHRALAVKKPIDFVEYALLTAPDQNADITAISQRCKLTHKSVENILTRLTDQQKAIRISPQLWTHSKTIQTCCEQITTAVENFHQQNPASIGIEIAALEKSVPAVNPVFQKALQILIEQNKLAQQNTKIHQPGFSSTFTPTQQKIIARIEPLLKANLFKPPKPEQIAQQTKLDKDTISRTLNLMAENGIAVQIQPDMFFHHNAIDRAARIINQHFKKTDRLESVDFKYMLDTSRKFALPILDYMDLIGITRRVGNTRHPPSVP